MSPRNAPASSPSEVCQLSGPLLLQPRRSATSTDGQHRVRNDPSSMRCSHTAKSRDPIRRAGFGALFVVLLHALTVIPPVHGQLELVQPAVANNKLHRPCRERPPGCALSCPHGYVWGFGSLCVCLCQPDPCLVSLPSSVIDVIWFF